MNPLALLIALFAVRKVVLVATLAIVQELCANAVMAAIEEPASALLALASVRVQLTGSRIESRATLRLLVIGLEAVGNGRNRRRLLRAVTLRLALLLLLKVVAVSVASSVVELATTCLRSIVVPAGSVVLARSQVSGQFASVLD